jgi:hypothetical protein
MRRHEHERLLNALLGPEGPQLTCEECFEQLDRYVELELAGSDADKAVPGMRAHLEGCHAFHDEHASLRDFVAGSASDNSPGPSAEKLEP